MVHARLRWLCRRGMRELDLVLERYLAEVYASAPPAEQADFERLAALQDDTLWHYLSGDSLPEDAALAELVAKLRGLSPPRP